MGSKSVPLTSLVKTSGCAAKIGPGVLHSVLGKLPKFSDPRLLVGFDTSDDACVYQISDQLVAIQTVDFFPPMVDDPYAFGQIAAANALSDIYAMGAEPATALNLICFPSCLDIEVLHQILEGGYAKVREAEAVIAGGHTISDPTPKYGLAVTGFTHPDHVRTNAGAIAGDVLILTKPIGIGILNTAAKAGLLSDGEQKQIIDIMSTLNKYAKRCADGLTVHACTDVTGFSLTGHAIEMAQASGKSIQIDTGAVPILSQALDYASIGIIPEGMYNNLDYLQDKFTLGTALPQNLQDVLLDPQTSGGLLLAMPKADADLFLKRMEDHNSWSRIIGEVTDQQEKPLIYF